MSALRFLRSSAILTNVLEVLFAIILMQLIANSLCSTSDGFGGFLLCRQCGLEITRADNLVNIPSQLAYRQRNDTLSGSEGVLIQLFRNPDGKYFEVITSSEAEVQRVDKPHSAHSWFPGFSWTVSVCPRCGQHLGWMFEPVPPSESSFHRADTVKYTDSFIGLILGNLLHEQEAESIIAVPKIYQS